MRTNQHIVQLQLQNHTKQRLQLPCTKLSHFLYDMHKCALYITATECIIHKVAYTCTFHTLLNKQSLHYTCILTHKHFQHEKLPTAVNFSAIHAAARCRIWSTFHSIQCITFLAEHESVYNIRLGAQELCVSATRGLHVYYTKQCTYAQGRHEHDDAVALYWWMCSFVRSDTAA